MMLLNKLIASAFVFFSFSALANEPCSNENMTSEIDNCYAELKNSSENRLNHEYSELKKRIIENYSTDNEMGKNYTSKLIDSQRSWLKYREKQCSMEALFADPGTQANITLVNKCVSRVDEQRITEMKALPY